MAMFAFNLSYSLWIARGLWPRRTLDEYPALTWKDKMVLRLLYYVVTLGGLTIPLGLWGRLKHSLATGVRRLTLWRNRRISEQTLRRIRRP